MISVTRLAKAGYVLGLTIALFFLLRPNLSQAQLRGRMFSPLQPMSSVPGLTNGMMGMGGGMGGMNSNLLQAQLMSEFGAIPLNGMMSMGGSMMGLGGGMMGMGGGMTGMGGTNMGGSMMGMGGTNIGGGMMGMGGGMGGSSGNLLQQQLISEFGAMPVNGMFGGTMMGMGGSMMGMGGMAGFAGKGVGGFNGRHGL